MGSSLQTYTLLLEGALGAISAHSIHASKESSKVIRDLSKDLDNVSVGLRKELIELDKSLNVQRLFLILIGLFLVHSLMLRLY